MNLFNSIITWFIKQRIGQIEFFINNPHEVQNDLFTKLISKAKDTEWGKKYDYQSIQSINDFKNRVPISKTMNP